MPSEPIIEVQDLAKLYHVGNQDVHALRGVSFSVLPGEMVAVVGASGSGKSTLLSILGCLDPPSSGHYRVLGQEVGGLDEAQRAWVRNNEIGFVFQSFNLLARTNAVDNVALPMVYHGTRSAGRRQRARELLELVGLGDRFEHQPTQLSGGQQQRVAIARALANGPRLILADEPTGNLDSATGKEILDLFKALNQEQGITLILVTHDAELAGRMGRIIRLKDGLIEGEERIAAVSEQTAAALQTQREHATGRGRRRGVLSNIRTALGALRANKLRSALTILGVIIGVATVIAMRAAGQGAQDSVAELLEREGTNRVTIYAGSVSRGGRNRGAATEASLMPDDATAIEQRVPDIRAVAPLVRGSVQVVNGNRNWFTRLYGTTAEYLDIMNWQVERGGNLNDADVSQTRKVVLLGKTPARKLFGNADPVGQIIRIRHLPFQVIGVLAERGSSWGSDLDDLLIIPLSTAQRRILGVRHLRYIEVGATSQAATFPVEQRITKLLRERHKIRSDEPSDFSVRNAAMIVQAAQQAIGILSYLLGIIAVISLAVGGIGIMNIMLVSVTERTREIGLRMALGARRRDIKAQFLTEAIVLSLVGGTIGVGLGIAVAVTTSSLGGVNTGYIGVVYAPVSLGTVLLAFAFSVAVGVFFGYHPASKAAKLDPMDALRYE